MIHSSPKNGVTRLDRHGHGVAGDRVFPRTLPGEVVDDEGRIVVPSADRVTPPCPHFRRCGGCALQHASDTFVADWKVGRVTEALDRVGVAANVAALHTSPAKSRRRAALKGRKTKKSAEVGLHAARSHDLVAIPDCRLLHPRIMAALPALQRLTRAAAPRGAEIGLHVTLTETGLDLSVTEAKTVDLAPFAGDFARITLNGEPALQSVRPELALGRARVTPPPGAFLQATTDGEAALISVIAPSLTDATRIVELFAGLGTFTFPAATHAPTDAFEGDPALVAALNEGARHALGTRAIAGHRRDLFREPLTRDELAAYDTAIVDPPRAGAAAQIAELAQSDVARIAHISCNPATFARDAATLIAGGYVMGAITVVDQFRWSPHIELAAIFERP